MALPAPSDNYADKTTGVGDSRFSSDGDFLNLSGPSMVGTGADSTLPLRSPAVLVADFKEVISDVRASIHDFLLENIRGSHDNEDTHIQFGFRETEGDEVIQTRRDEVSVAEVRKTLLRSIYLCESIASHGGDGTQVWDGVRALSNQFRINAQGVFIKMYSMKVDETIPSGLVGPVMDLLNNMQAVALNTALQLDLVTRTK